MTVEAKIRISTEGAQAMRVLQDMRQEFTKIGVDAKKAVDTIEAEFKAATAEIDKGLDKVQALNKELSKPGGGGAFRSPKEEAKQLKEQVDGTRSAVTQLLTALAGAETIRRAIDFSDTYSGLTARLRVATRSQTEFNEAFGAARSLASEYQRDLGATASALTRVLGAVRPLNGGLTESRNVIEGVLASLKISGATAEESASAILQFSQALGRGVLNGEEFNAVAEAAPRLLQALADGLGVPTSALKEMGAAGELSTSRIVSALTAALPQLREEAAQIPATIGSAARDAGNSLMVYVGQTAEASGATRALVDALRGIGGNIGPIVQGITTLAVLVGVTYVGRLTGAAAASVAFSASQLRLAAAATGAATGMNVATVAATRLLAVIGGPLGLVVALASLAAGWTALERAKNLSAGDGRGTEDIQRERDAVKAELDRLNERRKRAQVNALDGQTEARRLQQRLADLDKQLAERQQAAYDALRASGGPRGGGAARGQALLDPATVQSIEKEFQTRDSIERSYRTKRDQYIAAKDAEIAQARSRGQLQEVERLESQKTEVLQRIEQERGRAVLALDRDQQQRRVAQARGAYDAEAALQADDIERRLAAIQQAYQDGLVNYRDYLAQRAAAEQQAGDIELQNLQRRLAAEQQARSQNERLLQGSATPAERASLEDAIAKQAETIAKLETDIEIHKRNQLDLARARQREEQDIVRTLEQQRQQIDAMLQAATGTETADSVGRQVRQRYEQQLQAALQQDQDPAPLLKLIDVEVERARFELLLRQFNDRRDALNVAERAVRADLDAGLITEAEAEQRVLQLRQQSLQALRDAAAALQQQSQRLDEVAGKTQPKEAAAAVGAATEVKAVADMRTELEKTARSSAVSSISTELSKILSGSKKASEGLRDMVASFAKSMLDLIAKRLGEQLVNSLFGSAGGPAGGGTASILSSIAASFFHSGGVVAKGGGTRNFPASTWALAPRYHSGGIAGLAPNEVPAILQAGEEVLTADDPRHIKNMKRVGSGGVQVNNQVTISGAAGADSDRADAAQDLTTMINNTIDAWAVKQMRPGGILSGS
jgi:tape measure domain-containing protein